MAVDCERESCGKENVCVVGLAEKEKGKVLVQECFLCRFAKKLWPVCVCVVGRKPMNYTLDVEKRENNGVEEFSHFRKERSRNNSMNNEKINVIF